VAPARLDLARALLEGGDAPGAEKALRAALAQSKGESAAEANFLLAKSLWAQSKWKEAAESGLKVSALWTNSKWAPESAWIAAQATEKSGSIEAARTLYRAIAEAQPAGEWAAPAQEKLREMGE
jgi:FimV-like protein